MDGFWSSRCLWKRLDEMLQSIFSENFLGFKICLTEMALVPLFFNKLKKNKILNPQTHI